MAAVCLFLINDIVWANPDGTHRESTLAVPSQLTKEELKQRAIALAAVLMHPAANEALHAQIMADRGIFGSNWERDRTDELDFNDIGIRGNIKTRMEKLSKFKLIRVTDLFKKTGQFAHVGLSGKYKIGDISYDYGMPVIYIDALYYDKANKAALKHEIDELIQWETLRSIIANCYGIDRNQVNMREWIKAHISGSDKRLNNAKYKGLNSIQIAERIHKASFSLQGLYRLVNVSNDEKFFQHIDYDYIKELYDRYCDEEGKDINIAAKKKPKKVTGDGALAVPTKKGLSRAEQDEAPLYQAIREILPELPEYYPLDQRYSTGSDSRIRNPVKRDTQVEYTAEGETRTNRYADFFDIMNSPNHWPESNLIKDRIMADWLNRLVSLSGKTVVHYRSEYYPFFGLKATEYGATSYLVDPRRIPYVEDLLLGRKKFSRKAYLQAEEAARQISPLSEVVSKYTEELLRLPPRQLIELVVKTKFNIPDYIWDTLTKIERNYYILKWIKDNPGFSLGAARYFSNKVFQKEGHGEKNSWWSLSKEEQLPYVLEYIGENFLWAIKQDVHYAALSILRNKSLDSLPEELRFAYAAGDIYGRIVSNRMNWSIRQDDEFDKRWHEVLNEEMFSPDPATQTRMQKNVTFMHGNELVDLKMPDSSVDVIFSEYALNFIEDTVKFVAGVQRLLKPGGLVTGYIKARNDGIREFSVEELRAALMTMGFTEKNIVIVEYDWRTGDPAEYIFFARKSMTDSPLPKEASENLLPFPAKGEEKLLIPATDIPISGGLESRAVVRKDIVKNWQRDITLTSLSQKLIDLHSTQPQKFILAVKALYLLILGKEKDLTEEEVSKLVNYKVNIDNLVRYIVIKYPKFQDLKDAINNSGKQDLTFLLDDMEQFYLIREQIKDLLKDLAEMLDAANLFSSTDNIRQRLLQRAEIIGGEGLLHTVEGILNVINRTDLPWDEKERKLSESQRVLAKYIADYNCFLHIYYDVEPIFYSKHEHPSQPPPNRAYILKGSVGDVIHVSLADVNGKQYYVDNVYRNIYRDNKLSAEFISTGKGDKRYVVYMDTFEDSFAIIQREYRRHAVWGALVKRQWGGVSPSRSQFVAAKTRSLSLHEILHDVCPQMGEIPSYLAQIAYAPQPFEELFNKVLVLSELEEGGDIFYIINLINPEARSPHYQGSRIILAHYLKYALDNDRIQVAGLKERIESVIVFSEGRYELSETGARDNRDAIIATLSLLSEDEVRGIAKQWLRDEYNFVADSIPSEVSLSLPMPEEIFEQKDETALAPVSGKAKILHAMFGTSSNKSNLPVLANNRTLPQVVSDTLDNALPLQDNAERADRIIEVARSLIPFNADSAVTLIHYSIGQGFLRAKALVHLAISLENMGNKAKAAELLREAESILSAREIGALGDMGPYSTMGSAYFLREEIGFLKQKLGLRDEAQQDLDVLEEGLLPEGVDIKDMEAAKIPSLIECAVAKKDVLLLARIEEVVLSEDDSESNIGLKVQVGSAEAKIGNVERAHRLLKAVSETEPRWANATGIVEATLALANIGFAQEALIRVKEIQRIKDEPNRVGVAEDYLFTVSGRIKAKLGLIEEARKDFAHALEYGKKHRHQSDDWGFLHIIEAQLEYREYFLEDALGIANLMRDYKNRTETLIRIALTYNELRNKQRSDEILGHALKMAENIEDESMREIIKLRIIALQRTIHVSPAIISGSTLLIDKPKGSPAKFLETVRDKLLEQALSENGFAFKDASSLRDYHPSTIYKEIEILISLGILERVKVDGKIRFRFSATIRALDTKHAALLIDTINNIEYKIGKKNNPLQRYEIPNKKDKQFVEELVQNTIDIEKTIYMFDILPPVSTDTGRYYTIRYNENKLSDLGIDSALSKAIFNAYITLLRARLGGAERVELKTNNSVKQPIISVECYNNIGRTGAPIGKGNVNIKDGAFEKDSILRIINMANIAFAVSNIPLQPKQGELDQYSRLISFIQNQYRELTGKDISLADILKDDRLIILPAIRPIPFERLKEYYEFTIKQLEQAA